MISRVHVENFKAHADTQLELGQLTVLVGPNGAGKTSMLDALHYFGQLVDTPPGSLFRGASARAHLIRRGTAGFSIAEHGTRDDGSGWSAKVEGRQEGDSPYTLRTPTGQSTDSGLAFQNVAPGPLWSELRSVVNFRFDARKIADVGVSNRATPRVEFDGANTAAALAAMRLGDDERFEATVAALKKIVPSVIGLRVDPAPIEEEGKEGYNGYRFSLHFQNAPDIAAHASSEGTLITLALLTAINAKSRPRLILVDDIEHSLHPTAQIELMKQLSLLLAANPKLQLVVTTHSPYVLDAVEREDVCVFARREDGSVATRRLSEHPDAERTKGALSAGQLWSLDPETWVLAERAA